MLFIAFHFRTFYLVIPFVAFRINWAISVGWDTSEAWLEIDFASDGSIQMKDFIIRHCSIELSTTL